MHMPTLACVADEFNVYKYSSVPKSAFSVAVLLEVYLWPPCIADADIIFSSCGIFFFLVFFLA